MKQLPKSIQELVDKASKHSIEDLKQLATLTFDSPVYHPSLNPVFYAVLNCCYVPRVIHSGVVRDIMLAKWSIMGILGIYSWIDRTSDKDHFDQLNNAFATNWTHILKWVQFFNRNFLAQETCLQHHIDGLTIDTSDVLKFLVHVLMAAVRFSSDEVLPDLRSEQGVVQAISQLWHLVVNSKDPAVSRDDVSLRRDNIISLRVSVLTLMDSGVNLCAEAKPQTSPLPIMLNSVGGYSAMAPSALRYVRITAKDLHDLEPMYRANPTGNLPRFRTLMWAFGQSAKLVHVLSDADETLRKAFIIFGSMSNILASISDVRPIIMYDSGTFDPNSKTQISWNRQTLMSTLQYIPDTACRSPDGVSVLCDALRCRYMDMILLSGAPKSEGGCSIPLQDEQEDVILFILPVMCIFRRPLAFAIRSLERVSEPSRGIEACARKDVGRWKKWCSVKDALLKYKTFSEKPFVQPFFDQECGGSDCMKRFNHEDAERELPFRCSGCFVVKYCSKPCQKAAWKAGHRIVCGYLKLAVGLEQCRDIRRSLPLIAAIEDFEELSRCSEIQRDVLEAQTLHPCERSQLVLEIDLSSFPISHSIHTLSEYPEVYQDGEGVSWVLATLPWRAGKAPCMLTMVKVQLGSIHKTLFSPSTALKMAYNWPSYYGKRT